MLCQNCETEFSGNYCPQCGQKASVKRITPRMMFDDLVKKVLPWDQGFLYTTRKMLTEPGRAVRKYLAGKRARHTKPLSFLAIVVAASLILIPPEELSSVMMGGRNDPRLQQVTNWLTSHMTVVFILMIPFLAVFSRWFFRRHDVNVAEHAVLNAFVMGGMSILSLPIYFAFKWAGFGLLDPVGYTAQTVLYLAYFMWAYIQFFRPANPVWVGVKSVFVYLLGSMAYFFLAAFIGILIILLWPGAAASAK